MRWRPRGLRWRPPPPAAPATATAAASRAGAAAARTASCGMEHMTPQLIAAVRRRRVLYDPAHDAYKSGRDKSRAWESVAGQLAESTDVVKARWKNLRDSYGKHLRALKPGCRAKYCERYRAWPWVEHMAFLRPFLESEIDSRRRVSAPAPDTAPEPEPAPLEPYDGEDELVDEKPILDEAEFLVPLSDEPEPVAERGSPAPDEPPGCKRARDEPGAAAGAAPGAAPGVAPGALDDTDLIFLGYSRTLRRLSRARQAFTKFKIAKIMMEEELAQAREDAT